MSEWIYDEEIRNYSDYVKEWLIPGANCDDNFAVAV